MVIAAVVLLAPHLLAQPRVLTLPIMVAWAAALVRCMDRRAPPPYWALPLLLLWANLHRSEVLALGVIGPAVLEALLEEKRSEWPRVLLRWLPFTALAVAACCRSCRGGTVLNDYAFGGYLIFAGIPTFIDGRAELYGGQFIARYNRDVSLADLPDFLKLLDEYKPGATLLAPDTPGSCAARPSAGLAARLKRRRGGGAQVAGCAEEIAQAVPKAAYCAPSGRLLKAPSTQRAGFASQGNSRK